MAQVGVPGGQLLHVKEPAGQVVHLVHKRTLELNRFAVLLLLLDRIIA